MSSIVVSDSDAQQFAKDNGDKITAEYTAREKLNKGEQCCSRDLQKAPFPAQIDAENDPTVPNSSQRDDAKAVFDQVLVALKAEAADAAARAAAAQAANAEGAEGADVPLPQQWKRKTFAAKAGDSTTTLLPTENSTALTAEAPSRYLYGETVSTLLWFWLRTGQRRSGSQSVSLVGLVVPRLFLEP